MDGFLWIIKKSQIFSGISDEEIEEMLVCLGARRKMFRKGTFIIRPGDAVDSIGLMLSGKGVIFREDFWGNRNVISTIAEGGTFAETFACAPAADASVSVMAESDCEVMFLNVQRILTTCPAACTRHSRMIRNLLADMAEKNLALNEKLNHMAQRTTRAKLLSYLSAQAQKNDSFEFDIPFSRQQLADYLSVERSGLSAELSKMKRERLLDYRRNHFRLKKKQTGDFAL